MGQTNEMAEALLINRVLYERNVPVMVVPNHPRTGHSSIYSTPVYTVYEIVPYGKSVPIASVTPLLRDITQAIKDSRKQERLTCRWGDSPFSLEVPNREVRLLSFMESQWKTVSPYRPLTGRSYAYGTGRDHYIDFTNPNTTNVLVAGINGSGKTNTTRVLLSSLAMGSDPNLCQFVIIDPKFKGLRDFERLPHTIGWTDDPYEANKLIGWVWGEMERRKTEAYNGKIFLVGEEVSYLALEDMRDAFNRMLPQISLMGRQLDIHLIMVSQRPTAGLIGGQLKSQFGVKLVHRLDTADNARFVCGRPGTGAELLHGFGSHLLIDHEERPAHVQSYYIEDMEPVIDTIRERWPTTKNKINTQLHPKHRSIKDVEAEANKERARPVFTQFWDKRAKKLKNGGQRAIIEAMFGAGAYQGGQHAAEAKRVIGELSNELNDKKDNKTARRVSGNRGKQTANPTD